MRRQQKGRKEAERAGRDKASALKTAPCRCWSAFPFQAALVCPQRAPSKGVRRPIGRKKAERVFSAKSCAEQVLEHTRPLQLRGSWCSGITPAQHARGAGFNPRPVHAHVRLRWSFSLRVCCASCQGRLLRRGRVPNVTFESCI